MFLIHIQGENWLSSDPTQKVKHLDNISARSTTTTPNERPLVNILANVLIPVMVLHKLSVPLGPLRALILALSFPLAYGVWDYYRRKKINYFSILGLVNVLVTGSLAVAGLTGMWFAVKEAVFPALIGVFVFFSSYTNKPFAGTLLLNPQVMNLDIVEAKIVERGATDDFQDHLKKSTRLLSFSFFLSAVLNFVVALFVFTPLDPNLDETARSVALNGQIAHMTSLSLVVILIPSVIFVGGILYYMIKGLERLTNLKSAEILKS